MPEIDPLDLAAQVASIMDNARQNWPGEFRMELDDDRDDQGDPDDQDQDDSGDPDDQDDDDEGEYTPPSREEYQELQDKLAGQQELIKKLRKSERALKRGQGKDGDNGGDGDAEEKAAAKYKPLLVNQAAKAALLAAGLKVPEGRDAGAAVKRALKLLDHDELELDDDGEVDGLDEQIEDIKADYPELFATKQTRRGGRGDGADRGTTHTKGQTVDEQLSRQLNRR